MSEIFQKYGKISIFGKRILHVVSPVRWKGSKYEVERCSNWKVMMDTVNFLPMCHHYIMIPERNTLSSSDQLYSMDNVTIIPVSYTHLTLPTKA